LPNFKVPKALDRDDVAFRIFKLPEQSASGWIERVDRAIAKIANEQSATERPERRGSHGHAPGRIQRAIRSETFQEIS
jgi:hypothetical protein